MSREIFGTTVERPVMRSENKNDCPRPQTPFRSVLGDRGGGRGAGGVSAELRAGVLAESAYAPKIDAKGNGCLLLAAGNYQWTRAWRKCHVASLRWPLGEN